MTPKENPKCGRTLTLSKVSAIGVGDFSFLEILVLVPRGNTCESGDQLEWRPSRIVVEGTELAVDCWRGYVGVPKD